MARIAKNRRKRETETIPENLAQPAERYSPVSMPDDAQTEGESHYAAGDPGSDLETRGRMDTSRTAASSPGEDEVSAAEASPTGDAGTAAAAGDLEREPRQGPSLRLTGFSAIEYAEKQGLLLNKHPDRTSGPRTHLSIGEAEAIASEDESLVWLDVAESDYYAETPISFEPER